MGRSPCCDKVGLKKGPWTPEEDQKLLDYIQEHGHGSWRALPSKAGLQRCGKSCRLRWINYLRPDIKRGKFSLQEEQTIIQLHALLGNRWSAIATHLSKRTDNEIKNYWNTHLKKQLVKMGIDPVSHKPKNDVVLANDGLLTSTSTTSLSHMAQWESARLEAEARLAKQSKIRSMSPFLDHMSSNVHSLSISKPPPIRETWDNTPSYGLDGKGSEDSESTLSTTSLGDSFINFYELVVGGSNSLGSCQGYKDDGNIMEQFNDLTIPAIDYTWKVEPLKSNDNNNEHVSNGDFLESFTNLLLCSSNHNDSCNFTNNSSNSLVCIDDNGSVKNYYQDENKNY